jgi:DDE superfamily endonuclease
MLDVLRQHLPERPDQYLEEMEVFLWVEFEVRIPKSTISRTLRSASWSKKTAHLVAKEQNADLRDFYWYNLSSFRSYHLVYVDESGCDTRVGFRRTGWSPLGVTPLQVTQFHRGQRYQIPPAYSQNGILLAHFFQGATDGAVFEDFIGQLLSHCGRWPEPNSVLAMDNASFHHTERIKQMRDAAGVKLVYLPPYSPDLNPVEEFFAELKQFFKKHWSTYAGNPELEFNAFLEWCLGMLGGKEGSAKGHFRHAGLTVEDLEGNRIRRDKVR